MKKKIVSTVMALSMLTTMMTGCGSSNKDKNSEKANNAATTELGNSESENTEEGSLVNIYCWNYEFKDIYEKYASDIATQHGVKVNFVIVANENNAYQNNLDAALQEQENASEDVKADIFLVEADYASKYIKSGFALDVVKDVGLTEADLSEQYQYTKDIVTVDGAQCATSWQATPGLFAYRRSIAKEVLGTDDPDKVQECLADWKKFNEVARKMKDAGYFMVSGYDDTFRPFSNNMTQPWVDGTKIVLDDQIKAWIDQTKDYTDKGYNNKTILWAPEWQKDQGPDGKVFGFFYSTWGINFTLLRNSLADQAGEKAVGNGIYGDYAVCEGPSPYYWGGSWICAAKGSDNISFIKDLMLRLTCDKDTMKQITIDTQDYTNNQTAMNDIANSDYKSDFLGGQNHIKLFAEAAKKIDMSNISDYDQACNETIQLCFREYFKGNIDYDVALENFYKIVIYKHPELTK